MTAPPIDRPSTTANKLLAATRAVRRPRAAPSTDSYVGTNARRRASAAASRSRASSSGSGLSSTGFSLSDMTALQTRDGVLPGGQVRGGVGLVEDLAQGFAAAREPGLDRARRRPGLGGDLIDGTVTQVVQHDRAALLLGQPLQGRHDQRRLHPGRGYVRDPSVPPPRRQPRPAGPPAADRDPARDRPDPRFRLVAVGEAPPSAPGPDERLLHGVLGLAEIAGEQVDLPDQPGERRSVERPVILVRHAEPASPRCVLPPVARPGRPAGCSEPEIFQRGSPKPLLAARISVMKAATAGWVAAPR